MAYAQIEQGATATRLVEKSQYAAAFVCFFLSGFCALLYQVVWTRLAFAHFGIITPVLSIIVSVFMLGIGLGSICGAKWSGIAQARWGVRPIYLYACCEAFIGLGALLVPVIFNIGESWLLRTGSSDSAFYLFCSAIFISAALLPWCTAMGATIPFMMSFLRQDVQVPSDSTFSLLYFANVVGGALGAFSEAFLLIEAFGIRGTYIIAAVINLVIALTAASIGFRITQAQPSKRSLNVGRSRLNLRATPTRSLAVLFLTGFCSLGMEVAWARDFTYSLNTTIYAFAAILVVYLLSTAIGSYVYRSNSVSHRQHRLEGILAWLFVFSLLPAVFGDPRLGHSALRSLASIVPFCALLGWLTPSLVDAASEGDAQTAGFCYSVNVAGCIAGPLIASYILLPAVGIRWTIILLAMPFAFAFVAMVRRRVSDALPTAAVCVMVGAVACLLSRSYDDLALPGPYQIHRDYVASVIATGQGRAKNLYVNSIPITDLSSVTKIMAHLPMALNGHATSALDICFGMGTTFRALTTWGVDVTAVDLSKSVVQSFAFFHPDAATVLARPHVRVIVDDGRRFMMRTNRTFDVITIDPPPPVEAAGSSLLYSREFYRIAKLHLRPHGVLQQWVPLTAGPTLNSIALSLSDEFPFVKTFRSRGRGVFFIASMKPVAVPNERAFIARMPEAARRDLLEWEGRRSIASMVESILAAEIPLNFVLPAPGSGVPALTDDRPFNEYYFLRSVSGT